jgi:hypothetical protein
MQDHTINLAARELQLDIEAMRHPTTALDTETIIGTLATLAGERVLQSGDRQSKAAACAVIKDYAVRAGASEHQLPDIGDIWCTAALAAGHSTLPPLSIPRRHYPTDRSATAVPCLREAARRRQNSHRLSHSAMAQVLSHAIGHTLLGARDRLDPAIAANLALETLIGTTCLSPLAEEVRMAMCEVAWVQAS